MQKCSICLENKSCLINKNFNCNCSIFICNLCSNKLLSEHSIYAICPQCRNNKSFILQKSLCNKCNNIKCNKCNIKCNNIKCNKCNNIKLYLILLRDILITFTLWLLFLNLIGYYMISKINSDNIIINTEKLNKFILYLIIQPIFGLFTVLFVVAYLICCFYIIHES